MAIVSAPWCVSNAFASQAAPAPGVDTGQGSSPVTTRPARFALTLNLLNFIIGRVGVTFEGQPILHHSVVATIHYVSLADSSEREPGNALHDDLRGADTELGYRFYTGAKGFHGFFFGPSLMLGAYRILHNGEASMDADNGRHTFEKIGGALEVGAQGRFGNLVIGGGVGVQYTAGEPDFNLREDFSLIRATMSSGWAPRLLFNLGYAF